MIVIYLLIAFLFGLLIGLFYFGGLWVTIRKINQTKSPLALTMVSFLVRLVVSMFLFYFVLKMGDWQHLIAALIGFILMKFVLVQKLKPREEEKER